MKRLMIVLGLIAVTAAPCQAFENPDGKPGTLWLDFGLGVAPSGSWKSMTTQYLFPNDRMEVTTSEGGAGGRHFLFGSGLVLSPRMTAAIEFGSISEGTDFTQPDNDGEGNSYSIEDDRTRFVFSARLRFYAGKLW
jgi:hypothetical protein